MALNNKDLFLVSQATQVGLGTTYAEKKVKWSTIKSDLGIRNAKQEKDDTNGIPGMMFPDNSFDYNELSGRLTIPLDARGVKFVDLLDDDNKDEYPDGTEDAGDFYIVDQADLEVSSAKWKGISEVDVVADPSQQVIDIAGQGYSPNNGVATVLTLTEAGRSEVDFGPIECLIEDGKIIQATHLPTPTDLSDLALETRLFTVNVNNSFSAEKAGILECKNVTQDGDGNYVMLLSVVSQGEGHRLFTSAAGAFTGALATPQSGEATSFPVDVNIDENGVVTAITKVTLNSGHENGDKFDIVMPYGSSPVATASFQLVITGDAVQLVQINDKLIKRANGDWAILVDQLATQAVLTIKNKEEGGVDQTPALKIEREVVGDPRFLTLEIETVTSDQPGLMPPDLYDLLLSYPDTVGGGTVYNILIDDEASIDQLADLSYYSGPEINPVEVVDIVRYVEEGEPNSGEINPEEQKDVKISVGPATVFDTGGGEVRVRGTVYIATGDELISEFAATSIQISGDYDRAISSKIAGAHLMPRNLENLSERTEDFKTAKRLQLTTTSYKVEPAGLATLTSTLTYEDGTEVPDADTTSYTYLWQGTEYLGGAVKDLGTSATQLVNGGDFDGPTNITCKVTENAPDTTEIQTLEDSVYLHFGGGVSGPIDPPDPIDPPTDLPTLGNLTLTGPNEVVLEDDGTLNFMNYIATVTGGTAADVVFEFSSSDESIARHISTRIDVSESATYEFIAEGSTRIEVIISSESAKDTDSAYIDVDCKTLVTQLPDLRLRSFDFDNDTFMTKIEHILSEGQYDSEITYTLECDDPSVTITPIATDRAASTEHTFQVEASEGTYTFNGTAYPTDHPERVVTDSIDVTWVPQGSNTPSGSFIHFKAHSNKTGGTSKVKVTVTPAAVFKKYNFDTGLYEDLGVKTDQVIDHGGVKGEYTEWWIDSTNITHFKWGVINGNGEYPEIEFDDSSTTPALTSLKESFSSFKQAGDVVPLKLGWIDTSQVTNMERIFEASRLYNNDLDINGWDVSKVTTLKGMNKSGMVRANITSWDISSVTTLEEAFQMAGQQTKETQYYTPENSATRWDFSNVTDMSNCWYKTHSIWNNKWEVSVVESWEMGNVTDVTQMFDYDSMNSGLHPGAFSTQFNLWCAEKMEQNNNKGYDGFHKWWSKYSKDALQDTQLPQWGQPCNPNP